MTDFVRVRVGSREASVNRAYAAGIEGVEILDAPAVDGRGRPLPESDGQRPKRVRKTAKKAAAAKKAAGGTTTTNEPPEPGSTSGGVAAKSAQEASE